MKFLFAAALLATTVAAVPATASIVYMTGAGNPWGQSSNEAAMDAAFGAGNWSKIQGFSTSAFRGNSFIFMDGGDSEANEFGAFVSANGAEFGAFLSAGGHALVHAAPNQNTYSSYALPNGLTLDGISLGYQTASSNASLTLDGVAAGLSISGAGTSWTGSYFAHNAVFGGTCLITGDNGCILANSGNLWAGGETTSNFHSGGDPFQLRVNELNLAYNGSTVVGGVPEPASWAMMIAGFGLIGATMRRRAAVAA